MKRFTKNTLLSLTVALGVCLSSCLDDNEPLTVYSTLGTVTSLEPVTIDTDVYGIINPSNPSIVSSQKVDSIGQRVLANLYLNAEAQKPENNDVSIISLYKVLTKNANDTRLAGTPKPDFYGNSPIQVTGATLSKEHFNIQFNLLGEDGSIPHRISLLLTDKTKIDDKGYLRLDLRHDSNGDNSNTIFWGIASFTLSSISEINDPACKGIKIYYNSGAYPEAYWKVEKKTSKSDKSAFLRMMESSQEVSDEHSLLASQLQ